MKLEKRCYYADDPSPAHEALEKYHRELRLASLRAQALAEEVGAEKAIGIGQVTGFFFPIGMKADEEWKLAGHKNDRPYYAPKSRNQKGRLILDRMKAIRVPTHRSLLLELGLFWMAFDPDAHAMTWSTIGWKNGRIFFRIPFGGEGNDGLECAIPDWLIPCRKWEMEKWYDEN